MMDWKDFASGAVAGACEKIVIHPLDTLKVVMQSQGGGISVSQTMRAIYSTAGFRGLYRGVSVPMFGASIENAILFVGYNTGANLQVTGERKASLSDGQRTRDVLTLAESALSGAIAGLFCSLWLTPTDFIKSQIQALNSPYKGPLDATIKIARRDGLFAFTRGFVPTLFREVPGNAIWYVSYYVAKERLRMGMPAGQEMGPMQHIIAGGFAGCCFWLFPFPLDVIKSRMQADVSVERIGNRGFLQVARSIWQTQGIRGFYAGFAPTALRAAPASAVLFTVYEQVSGMLDD